MEANEGATANAASAAAVSFGSSDFSVFSFAAVGATAVDQGAGAAAPPITDGATRKRRRPPSLEVNVGVSDGATVSAAFATAPAATAMADSPSLDVAVDTARAALERSDFEVRRLPLIFAWK